MRWEVLVVDEIQMMVSGRLKKDGREIVRVSFFRNDDYADGVLPDAVIEKTSGFEEKELAILEKYLRDHKDEIYAQARTVNPMKNFLGL